MGSRERLVTYFLFFKSVGGRSLLCYRNPGHYFALNRKVQKWNYKPATRAEKIFPLTTTGVGTAVPTSQAPATSANVPTALNGFLRRKTSCAPTVASH